MDDYEPDWHFLKGVDCQICGMLSMADIPADVSVRTVEVRCGVCRNSPAFASGRAVPLVGYLRVTSGGEVWDFHAVTRSSDKGIKVPWTSVTVPHRGRYRLHFEPHGLGLRIRCPKRHELRVSAARLNHLAASLEGATAFFLPGA